MGIHVRNGTPMHGPSLCESCSRAHIAKGYGATEVVVICDALYRDHRVLFPIRQCTHYLDKNRRDLEEMEEIAWILATPSTKRKTGFVAEKPVDAIGRQIELTLDDDEE
jgi:hypothetical protein